MNQCKETPRPRVKITAVGDRTAEQMLIVYTTKKKYNELTSRSTFNENLQYIKIDDIECEVKLWDMAEQEKYTCLLPLSYTGTACFIMCFSIASEDSYNNARDIWWPSLQHNKPTCKIPIILVGTNSDLRKLQNEDAIENVEQTKIISKEDGYKLQKMIKAVEYMECSLVDNEGIEEIFEKAIRLGMASSNKSKRRFCLIL